MVVTSSFGNDQKKEEMEKLILASNYWTTNNDSRTILVSFVRNRER